jgi:peptidoglycan/xylan/chitin deacetylase (PgdA/CDA1 family)
LHSWDSLNPNLLEKLDKIIKILKNKNYQFLTGREIYGSISKNR